MQVTKIANNSQTAFKASLPKKNKNCDLSSAGMHDFWDVFAAMCEEDGNSFRLQKCLEDLQKVEKDKILAFDKLGCCYYRYPNTYVPGGYSLGLFDSQESLDNARIYRGGNNNYEKWFWGLDEYIGIEIFEKSMDRKPILNIRHNGELKLINPNIATSKINSKFFLDILEKMIKNMKANVEPSQLIEKFRIK